MAVLTKQSYERNILRQLEARGWVYSHDVSRGETTLRLGDVWFHDLEAAVDHQRHLEEVAYREKHKAKPRYHWGLDVALALGAKP